MNPNFWPDLCTMTLELFLPVFVATSVLSVLGIAAMRLSGALDLRAHAPFVVAFGFLGSVPGLIAGASHEPIVGGLLTGLLGLVSSLLAYLFSKDSLEQWRPVIPFAIILMVIGSLAGLSIGSVYKNQQTEGDRIAADYRAIYDNAYVPAERLRREIEVRKAVGLPPEGSKP